MVKVKHTCNSVIHIVRWVDSRYVYVFVCVCIYVYLYIYVYIYTTVCSWCDLLNLPMF